MPSLPGSSHYSGVLSPASHSGPLPLLRICQEENRICQPSPGRVIVAELLEELCIVAQ